MGGRGPETRGPATRSHRRSAICDALRECTTVSRKPRFRWGTGLSLVILCAWLAGPALAASLQGSRDSMLRQNRVAREHDFTFLRNRTQLQTFVENGWLVRVPGDRNYELSGVSFPYARPALKLFIERLAAQYRDATGEKLVVTSLTRPLTHQPHNASSLSVHPTGMAVDFRISKNRAARRWLENVLLDLERKGVAEATRERRPPHYHVALFPEQYEQYVEALERQTKSRSVTHRVAEGDTLWDLARRYDTSVDALRRLNDLGSAEIRVGQVLRVR